MDAQTLIALIGVGGALGGTIVGSAVSSVTTILIARAERTKFARERLWETRREAYTTIIATVSAIERHAAQMDYEFSDEAGGENYFRSERFHRQAGAMGEMHKALLREYANNRLIMSQAMASRFEELIFEIGAINDNPNQTPDEEYSALSDTYAKANHDILSIGQGELGVTELARVR